MADVERKYEEVYIYFVTAADGSEYGRNMNPETGDFYVAVKAAHGRCLNGGERASMVFINAGELERYPTLEKKCDVCGDDLKD